MAVTSAVKDTQNTNGAAGSLTCTSRSYASGTRVALFVCAQRNSHTNGLAGTETPTSSATTNTVTWTELVDTGLDTAQGASFGTRSWLFISSELTATESFTCSFDPGTSTYFIGMITVEVSDSDGTLIDSGFYANETRPGTISGMANPTSGQYQHHFSAAQVDGNLTSFDAAPTNFTDMTSGEDLTNDVGLHVMDSSTNTDGTVSFDCTPAGGVTVYNWHRIHVSWTEAAGGDATVTPGAIATTVSMPAATPVGDANVAPGAISALSTVPTPSVVVGTTVTPSAVSAVASMPAPTAVGDALVSPSAVAATTALPTSTPVGDAVVSPASVDASVLMPFVTVSVEVAAAVIAAVTAMPAPTTDTGGGNATVSPGAIAATVAVPQVAIPAEVLPSAISATIAMPAPSVGGDSVVSPDSISSPVAMPAPAVSVEATPGSIAGTVSIPAPTILLGADPQPGTIAILVSLGQPGVAVVATPSSIAAAVAFPSVTAGEVSADTNPITMTVREFGHTETVSGRGHTASVGTLRHTATKRENP